ncbi:MAG: carboxyl transferase domain-containing protein, partial [Flavobacteriales bacterium]
MGWFSRKSKNIQTPTDQKKDTPDGFWHKTPSGNIVDRDDLEGNNWVSEEDHHHFRIGSKEYFSIIFDDNKFTELDKDMVSKDPLKFTDTKSYDKRLEASKKKSGLKDAVRTGYGKTSGQPIVVACMDFAFIGGSMGSVVGEKIARAIDHAIKKKCPFMMISKSGGARMME